ncbi:amidohydrolase family protein [Kibdelosporangium aridum]|uniref:amidohydrolase family protein n=1 Tax=Kibdelosporangium aridum TaxID=2030 RepID=UPI0006896466|nr:amidohydrolase family protein [Kibdelosporangium aridum]
MINDQADAPSGKSSRRSFLKTAGIGAVCVGAGAAAGPVYSAVTSSPVPPRVEIPRAQPLRIDGVTVVDPRDGSAAPNMSVLVRNGRIVSVAAAGSIAADRDVRIVDGAGRFVVPGYNNMHSHALQAQRPALMLAAMLAEGVTGMRQMLGTPELLRYRADHRLPLTQYAPALLSMPGDLLLPFNVGSADAAREEIDRQWEQGADFVKVILIERDAFFAAVQAAHAKGMRIAGHLPPSVDIIEASKAGYDSIEHLGTGNNVWIACSTDADRLRTEQDTSLPVPGWVARLPFAEDIFAARMAKQLINPAAFADPDNVALLRRALDTYDERKAREMGRTFAANGTWQSPTLVRLRTQYLADAPEYQTDPQLRLMSEQARKDYDEVLGIFTALPAEIRATYRRAYDMSLALLKIWHEEGVPIMTATDGMGSVPGQRLQLEFREMAKAGLRPRDILRAATAAPAEYLGRTDTMGRVAVGMDADFLLLDSDPLADVANLAHISAVVRSGHLHTSRELAETVERLRNDPDPAASTAFHSVHNSFDPCCGR